MTLDEVLRVLPAARRVLEARNIHAGSTYLARGVQTLLDIALAYDLDLSDLMNDLLQGPPPTAAPEGTETPIIPVIRPRSPSAG
jgi:hypothetical protein